MERDEEFVCRLQKGNRVQIPVLIRRHHRLAPGEILRVSVHNDATHSYERFYARLGSDGRFTVPRIIVNRIKANPHDILEITLYAAAQRTPT